METLGNGTAILPLDSLEQLPAEAETAYKTPGRGLDATLEAFLVRKATSCNGD